MHVNSYQIMASLFTKFIVNDGERYPYGGELNILDVGSMDVRGSGSYRNLFTFEKMQQNWSYKGLDIAPGNNVHIVAEDPYHWPIPDASVDVVISGQCLEHVEAIWLWAKEVERICKPGGLFFIIVPFEHKLHRYPLDCWRFLPDGLNYLFCKHCSFECLESDIVHMDTYLAGRKK